MRRLLLLFLAIYFCLNSYAQLPNDSLEFRVKPDSAKTGNLELSIYNLNFLRNYEYFNDFQDGLTLFGTQLEPKLNFYANPKLVLSAGVHLRKDYGNEGVYKSYPIFSLKYQHKDLSLITGALEGNIHHRFIEPIFDFERRITAPIEYGTQVVINKPSLFLDAFINWNRMIYRPSPVQEQIYAGGSADIRLLHNKSLSFSIPVQAFVFHQGGQIDTDPAPLQTKINTAIGFKVQVKKDGFINKIRTENYYVTYKDVSPSENAIYSGGHALFFNAGFDTKRYGNLTASYWEGNKYVSPLGMPIYQSVSQQLFKNGYAEDLRQLLIFRYIYQKQLVSNLFLDFRIEPVFDLKSPGSKKMEFSHSLFLLYKQDFKLLKKK